MAYQDDQNRSFQQRRGPSTMVDVSSFNIVCAMCGTPIKELPFNPSIKEDGTYGKIYCFDCNKKRPRAGGFNRGGFGGGRGGNSGGYQNSYRRPDEG